ncbi:MAG: ATP-binding cassette domain-containing protein [Muribaculaceae bacterium]|nr:ATP-binding cassette domain-containing protein [Muribaculaceae bacterium]
MREITLLHLLPNVFKGMEDTSQIRESRIWDAPPFTFKKGCRICIHAESGGGKSSLLSFIYGQRHDYSGEILFDNQNIRSLSIKNWCEIRRHNIALLPQEMRLFPELTVWENISLKNNLTHYRSEKELLEFLSVLGIQEKKNTPVNKLSIGQQQRVAIIRTLCQPFDFIFLDEPVSHLDEPNNKIVAELVEEEAGKLQAGIITTSVGNHLLLSHPEFVQL